MKITIEAERAEDALSFIHSLSEKNADRWLTHWSRQTGNRTVRRQSYSINVQDFEKLNADEWLRLIALLDTEFSQQELRDFFHLLRDLQFACQGKYHAKEIRQTLRQWVKQSQALLAAPAPEPSSDWRSNFVDLSK